MSKKENNAFSGCPCSGTTLDRLVQPAILAILADGQVHGYQISKRLETILSFSEQPPNQSGVYRFLKSLEVRGLVESFWDTEGPGHAKRLFTLTDSGRECLKHWTKTLANYSRAISMLLETAKKAAK
ncbi:MAG: PadR family transcriptional regulator [Thermoguttaceae bacterium]